MIHSEVLISFNCYRCKHQRQITDAVIAAGGLQEEFKRFKHEHRHCIEDAEKKFAPYFEKSGLKRKDEKKNTKIIETRS